MYIYETIFFFTEEIYNEFKSFNYRNWNTDKIECIIGDNRIFLLPNDYSHNNSILVLKSNDINNILELELILYFNRDAKFGLTQIKENGFEKFLSFLLFDNDLVSPIFDTNQNQIGTAYKYVPNFKDYTNLNINFDIRKMFLLYSN